MKKTIISLFSIALLFSYSCQEDELVIEPILEDIYTGNLESEEDMFRATNKIYESLASGSVFGAELIIDGDLISDNVFGSLTFTSGYYQTENGMSWSQDTGFGFWRGLYDVVQKANIVILDENVPITDNVRSYKGEAKIARGLANFYLVQLFSSNPTSGQHQEFGVPLMLEKYDVTTYPARATVDQVYEQIIKDLTEGIQQMSPSMRGSKSYLSPTAGNLILAKVFLTRGKPGDYEKAILYANEVLNTNSPLDFSLLTNEEVESYFTASQPAAYENQPETIFEIEQNTAFTLGINAHPATFYANTGAHKGLLVRKAVYDSYDETDIRLSTFNPSNAPDQDEPMGVWTKKYPRSVGGNYQGNIKVFRMTEAKYIKMEALAKSGDTATALSLLNTHAVERGAQPYSGDVLAAILLDSQKEFIAEGHRFFDLKRNNLPIDKGTNCTDCFFDASSRYFVFPISLSERLLNPNMTQHPLWQ